jgi:hypothetical protein
MLFLGRRLFCEFLLGGKVIGVITHVCASCPEPRTCYCKVYGRCD